MNYIDMTCMDFTEMLSSSKPVPGGGGACALCGAIGTALGHMVGSLTVGKKKYAAVEGEMEALMGKATDLQARLLTLMDRDAAAFEPLSVAYRMPKETESEKVEKDKVMEKCLKDACQVPLEIMQLCCEAIDVTFGFSEMGSRMAISDAGTGAALLCAALKGASLNVYANTSLMKDRGYAEEKEKLAEEMLSKYQKLSENIFDNVKQKMKK